MRHYNPVHTTTYRYLNPKHVCNEPYQRGYSYTRPTKKCWYVKILQFVYDHPNCTRHEILSGIFPLMFKTIDDAKRWGRGYASNVFANMLFDDLIDYDKKYRYTIRERGLEILKKFYVSEALKTNFRVLNF